MGSGKYRHRVRVQQPVETIVNGSPKYLWADLGWHWAQVRAMRGTEPVQAQSATVGLTTYEITLRYLDITSKHRIIHAGKVYHLSGVVHDGKKTETICTATVREGELPSADFTMSASGGITTGGSYE